MALVIDNGNVGQGIVMAAGTASFATFLTNNATVISLLLTFLSFIVGGIFLYLNRKDKQIHDKIMQGIALRELQLKEREVLQLSLKD